MRKSKTLLILFAVLAILIAGCTSDKGNGNGDGSAKPGASGAANNGGAPVTLKVFSQFMPNDELDGGAFTQFIEKKFNVKLEWNAATRETFEEKKKLVMASGDYPDLFIGEGFFTKQEQMLYGEQGILAPLNPLIEQYGTAIRAEVLPEFPDFLSANTAPDGNIYGLPSVNDCYHCDYSQKLWINTAWLAKVGLSMPTTTEEYYQVLKAFKEKDPNGNGKADEIPLSGSEKTWHGNVDGFLMNAFIYNDSTTYLRVIDGKVELVADQPEWKAGLQYLRKLYDEGLLDKNAFIQDGDALGALGMNPEVALLGSFPHGVSHGVVWPNEEGSVRHKDYQAVPPLKGPGGVQLSYRGGESGALRSYSTFSISAASKHKELAMQIADYLYSKEGTVGAQRGREGSEWKKAGPDEIGLDGNPAEVVILPTEGTSWNNLGPHTVSKKFRESEATTQDPDSDNGGELKWYQASALYEPFGPKETLPPMFITAEQVSELSQIQADLTRYVKESMVSFILGEQNFEGDWDKYVSSFANFKADRYVAIYQGGYDNIK